LLGLIWDDDEGGILTLFEGTETFQERFATSTVKVIRSELSVLNKEARIFGRFYSSVNLEILTCDKSPEALKSLHQSPGQRLRRYLCRLPLGNGNLYTDTPL
jgi:hypothetical protein